MGNIILAADGTIQNSILADKINDWAKHTYHDGLNYENHMLYETIGTNPKYDDLLMKRACCTGQTSMNIALPNAVISNEGKVIGISTVQPENPAILRNSSGNIIGGNTLANNFNYRDSYIPLKVNIFDSSFDLTTQCYFENSNLYAVKTTDTGGFNVTPACKALYRGEAHNKGLCEHVEHDRAKVYTTDTQIAYGPYLDDNSNVYPDCNCENSLLRGENRNLKLVDKSSGRPVYNADDEMLAQFFDKRCFSLGPAGFKPWNAIPQNLCININQTQNISADTKSTINQNQTCNLSNSNTSNDFYAGIDPTRPTEASLPEGRDPPNPNFIESNKNKSQPTTTAVVMGPKKMQVSKGVIIGTITGGSVMMAVILGFVIYEIVIHVRKNKFK